MYAEQKGSLCIYTSSTSGVVEIFEILQLNLPMSIPYGSYNLGLYT